MTGYEDGSVPEAPAERGAPDPLLLGTVPWSLGAKAGGRRTHKTGTRLSLPGDASQPAHCRPSPVLGDLPIVGALALGNTRRLAHQSTALLSPGRDGSASPHSPETEHTP